MHKTDDIAKIFMKEIFKLHGLPKAIVSDRDVKFISNFWKVLFVDLGTKLNLSTGYYPHNNGKKKRVNQVLERIGPVAYRLAFLASTKAHNVFHVSLLKRYVHDPNHVINWDAI